MNPDTNSSKFQHVKSKRGPGPRGERKQKQKQNENSLDNRNRNHVGTKETVLSFRDLLFQNNNLKKYEHSPKVDLWEEKDNDKMYYLIRMEIPGIDSNRINIDIIDNQNILVTAFKSDNKPSVESVVYSECKYGKIVRRVKVPNMIYKDDVCMRYEDGILQIKSLMIPKKDTSILDCRLDDNIDSKINNITEKTSNLNCKSINDKNFTYDKNNENSKTINWADDICE